MADAVKSKLDEAQQEFRRLSQVKEKDERLVVINNFYASFFCIDIIKELCEQNQDLQGYCKLTVSLIGINNLSFCF